MRVDDLAIHILCNIMSYYFHGHHPWLYLDYVISIHARSRSGFPASAEDRRPRRDGSRSRRSRGCEWDRAPGS